MARYFMISALASMSLLVSGCSLLDKAAEKATEKVTEKVAEEIIEGETDADVDLTDDGFTVTDDDGSTVSFGEDVALPDTFPSDVPIVDGASIIAASSTPERGEHSATLSTTNFAETEAFYQEELVDEGWTIDDTSSLTIGTNITTITASKSGRNLTVGIYASAEDEVSVIITVTSGD